jgi:hypothetical protein
MKIGPRDVFIGAHTLQVIKDLVTQEARETDLSVSVLIHRILIDRYRDKL